MNYYNENILNLLSNDILNLSLDELKSIYKSFENEGVEEISVLKTKNIFRECLSKEGVQCRQFDLPYFMNFNKEKTIMIIGMDAKTNHANEIRLSTPYFLQSIQGRETNSNDYWKIIKLLSESYNIFLTDVYKAYFKMGEIVSNKLPVYKNNSLHANFLIKEILEVNPYAILCWGKESRSLVAETLNIKLLNIITRDTSYPYKCQGDIKLVATPHPSNRTWIESWLSFYENNLKGVIYSKQTRPEVLANFILDKLKY